MGDGIIGCTDSGVAGSVVRDDEGGIQYEEGVVAAECCRYHCNPKRAAVIPGDAADSDVSRVIGDDRIAAAEEHVFAHRHILL